ncbi:hypothetical protein PGTUg99_030843 [Puccinia graminis f. sp. tritici]|uniref:Peroxin-5 n=1 Tax=Puccinia graminis f. sp. tritici TaxID=56615 RepID=A0A5B0NXC1_PUCGR|nr:hypothetical protein PGTUg99_030843 [Puccinia graminis f. sp. tritici]
MSSSGSSSLGSLLLQGSSSDSCQNQNGVNPLSSLTKTFERQPYASEHRFQPTTIKKNNTARTTTNELHQQLTQEQQAIYHHQDHHKNWSTAFLRSVPIQSFLHSSSINNPQWQSEFNQSQSNQPQRNLEHQELNQPRNIVPSTSHLGPSLGFSQPGRLTPHHHPYHPIQPATHLINQEPAIQHSNSTTAPDWDSAFLKYDHHLPSTIVADPVQVDIEEQRQINQEPEYLARSHSPINSSSPDALSKTAASLIATVENGKQAQNSIEINDHQSNSENSTADKFTQSSFMEFMRQLRDGEVKVEGDKVVQQIAPVRGSSSAVNHSTQINDPSTLRLQPQTSAGLSTHPQNAQTFGVSRDLKSEQAQSNAQPGLDQVDSSYQAMMNRFQGDGGGISESDDVLTAELEDILNAASEVGRPEKQTWTNTATHVPGATESWTEEFDQPQSIDTATATGEQENLEFDEMGMFGRPIHAREFELERLKRLQQLPSAQQQEWERLHSDWETMANDLGKLTVEESTSSSTTISPAMYLERINALKAETGYNFQQANPQLFIRPDQTNRSMHHSIHEPWEDSTLDAEIISPLESVLQKEKEVLSDPSSAIAWYELGVKQQENEREEMAIQALQQAIKLDPELSDAILALAISYSNENRRAEAFEEIERWIQVESSRVPKYRHVALAHSAPQQNGADHITGSMTEEDGPSRLKAKHGELTGRLIELARLGGRIPESASVDPDVQIALGVLFNSNDEFEKACDCFSTALAVRPDDPLLFNRLGATLANSGKPEEAIEYYHRAIELSPSYIRARYNLSISLINLGKYMDSIRNLFDALVIQDQASSSSSTSLGFSGVDHQATSGVTSDVLWQTLEINCSLVKNHFIHSQNDLESCLVNKDLTQLKVILPAFI